MNPEITLSNGMFHPDTSKAINNLFQKNDLRIRVYFKYQTIKHYTLDTLKSSEIYFSRWEELNDVFDPLLTMVARANSNISLGDDEQSTKSYDLFAEARLFCLSEECDNQVMWSHYADVYRGFCIGYASYQANELGLLVPVNYMSRLPDELLTRSSFTEDEIVHFFLMTKPSCWAYEKEWRLIVINIEGRYPSPLPIVSIIFGYQMSLEKRILLVEATKASNPRLYVAQPVVDDGYFRINITQCSIP